MQKAGGRRGCIGSALIRSFFQRPCRGAITLSNRLIPQRRKIIVDLIGVEHERVTDKALDNHTKRNGVELKVEQLLVEHKIEEEKNWNWNMRMDRQIF